MYAKSIIIALSTAIGLAATSAASAQARWPEQPSIGGGLGNFCLKSAGPLNCSFQSSEQCRLASNQGNAGNCVANPAVASAAVVRPAGKRKASAAQARAAFAQSVTEVAPIGYDTGRAPIFADQLSPSCTLPLKQLHRC